MMPEDSKDFNIDESSFKENQQQGMSRFEQFSLISWIDLGFQQQKQTFGTQQWLSK